MITLEQEQTKIAQPPTRQPDVRKEDEEPPLPDSIYVLDDVKPEHAALGIVIREEAPADRPTVDILMNEPTAQGAAHGRQDAGLSAFSRIAEQHGTIVGYIAVSRSGHSHWYTLDSLSVRPEKHCLGIGTQLVIDALTHLRHIHAAGCTTLGDPHFFSRFGFAEASMPTWTSASSRPHLIIVFNEPSPLDELTTLNLLSPPDTLGL